MNITFGSYKGRGSKEGVCHERTGDCGNEREVNFEPRGTATLWRCKLSAVVKSLPEKCLLHKYLLCSTIGE
jgi:hypothetical protein